MNKKNPNIEELKALAKEFIEKAENLTFKEIKEEFNLLSLVRDLSWWINPPACDNRIGLMPVAEAKECSKKTRKISKKKLAKLK